MQIKSIARNRGITAIYDGTKYVIWSSYYGVVAYSKKIFRDLDEPPYWSVAIDFSICDWIGEWSLQRIIERGVREMERQVIKEKKVYFNYIIDKKHQNSLPVNLVAELEEY